jgi:hypothetical protein
MAAWKACSTVSIGPRQRGSDDIRIDRAASIPNQKTGCATAPVRNPRELKTANPRTALPIAVLPAMVRVLVMPMILRVRFMDVPPIIVMVREDHT